MRTEEQLRAAMRTAAAVDVGADTSAILRAARRRLLGQRVAAGAMAIGVAGAGATAISTSRTGDSYEPVTQPVIASPATAQPTISSGVPSATQTASEPTATSPQPLIAHGEAHIDLGSGWSVYAANSDICTHTPIQLGATDQCVSTTDGNRSAGELYIHGTGYLTDGAALVATYAPSPLIADTVVIAPSGDAERYAQVVLFDDVPGWTYYFDLKRFDGVLDADLVGTVTAYAAGREVATLESH